MMLCCAVCMKIDAIKMLEMIIHSLFHEELSERDHALLFHGEYFA